MKKLLSIFLALCLLTGALTALAAEPSEAAAAEDTPQQMADALYLLGLFQGSDKGYELDRELTRVEAITLVVRMVGAEKEAMEGSYTHPFTDVPDWADPYVAYAYTKGITKGITAGTGELLFGSNDLVTGSQFLTFVLRVLGYQDANDGTGDFTWDAPYTLAETIGLAASSAEDKSFVRGGAVEIIWSALSMQMKDQTDTLADTLMEKGVFTQESLEQAQALLPSQQEGPAQEDGKKDGEETSSGNNGQTGSWDDDEDDDRPSVRPEPDPDPEPDPEPDPDPDFGTDIEGDDEWGSGIPLF